MVYRFDTAWSRPLGALAELSSQYPDLLFTLDYEEETGWGGETEILRGEITAESSYESKCWECDATDSIEWNDEKEVNICSDCGNES